MFLDKDFYCFDGLFLFINKQTLVLDFFSHCIIYKISVATYFIFILPGTFIQLALFSSPEDSERLEAGCPCLYL